ncbi:MAG: F0F1 ATP synthase subunit gamma [Chromatiales bacterium]|nr:F0F1 ATP synthase subunit gamma [Chromatiales bacterium]
MAGTKEIRNKIRSVRSTQKITKAMEKVAASKLRRTNQRMEAARPYADKIRSVIGRLYRATPDYQHPFLVKRDTVNRVGFIVITSDRGLCGGLNVNLFRQLIPELRHWQDQGAAIDLCLLGAKGVQYFRRLNINVVAATTHMSEDPRVVDLIGAVSVMLNGFSEGHIDRLFLVHNEFLNTMSQKPAIKMLLPVDPPDQDQLQGRWDYIYEPGAAQLLDGVLKRYMETQVYRAVVENVACEMAAKMVAMKAATDNAGNLIDSLQLQYNKARQAAITQEIAEIVGGAAAV